MATPLPPPRPVPRQFGLPEAHLELPVYWHPAWLGPPSKPGRSAPQPVLPRRGPQAPTQLQQQEGLEAQPVVEPVPSFSEVRQFSVPLIDKEIPLPAPEILVTAVSTAAVASAASVGATLAAQSLFKQVMKLAKPLTKTILKKLAKARKKPPPLTWARERQSAPHRRRSLRNGP